MRSKPKGAKYRNLADPDPEEIEHMARENDGGPAWPRSSPCHEPIAE